MQKLYILIAITFVATTVNAQNINDVTTYGTENLQGTARFQSMSGAFGALGGDLSAIDVNPAGSAVFNNSFITTSVSVQNVDNSSFYGNGNLYNENSSSFNINQLGAVLVLKSSNDSDWKKIALSFNYNIFNNFDSDFFVSGTSNQSIDQYFLNYAQGQPLGEILIQGNENIEDAYLNIATDLGYAPQQAFLGYFGGVIDPADDSDDDNTLYFSNADYNSVIQDYAVSDKGLNSKFTANFATQYGENLYMGASVNINVIDREKLTTFYEDGYSATSPLGFVSFDNYLKTYGNGVSVSFGGIAKITEMFRLGASYQSPTWYNLTDELSQRINSNLADQEIDFIDFSLINVFPDYKITVPAKLTASGALVLGQSGLISVDYGYQNMANSRLRPESDSNFAFENNRIKNELKAVSTFKVGGEYKINRLSLRGGFRYEESPYKSGNMIGDLTGFSLGAGYNFGITRFDLAFSQSQRDIDYRLFETGLINTATIDRVNSNVTLSVSINL